MRKPQRQRVYEYMRKHGGITSMQAFRDLNITRLSARIYDLKNHGVNIDKEHIVKKVDGERVEYDRYFVAKDNRVSPTKQKEQSDHSEEREQVVHRPIEAVS